MTVARAPSTSIVRPTIDGSAEKACFQNPCASTTAGAALGSVSACVNVRPINGLTPSAWNRSAVTIADTARRGSVAVPTFAAPTRNAPMLLKLRERSFRSKYSGGEIQNCSKPRPGNWLEMNSRRSASG
jgi:hypothetical protein